MKTLNMSIADKRITFDRTSESIVCGNSDYQIQFTFDSEWNGYTQKTARFVWNGVYQDVNFTGNVCAVPVILNAEHVFVGVYAGDLCTTTSAVVDCEKSIMCGTMQEAASGTGGSGGTKLYRHYMTSFDFYAVEIICTSKKPFQITQSSDGVVGLPIEDGTTLVSALLWNNPSGYKITTLAVDKMYILGDSITEQFAITQIEGTNLSMLGFSGDTVTEL